MNLVVYVIVVGLSLCECLSYESHGFDDSILYRIDWPGENSPVLDDTKFESIVVSTHEDEKYRCSIPHFFNQENTGKNVETGLSPLHFIKPIFSASSCSYRIEAYWTYEICHGHHVKQYHEERDGKSVKVQEYYLGKWSDSDMQKLTQKLKEDEESGRKFKTTKIDSVQYPYLEMEMGDGTLCDINNEPRVTKVRYVCYPQGKNEIYSLKETSTCSYEVIILTSALCMHPEFVPEDSTENVISCVPIEDAPKKPHSLLLSELDNLNKRYKQVSGSFRAKENIAIIKVDPKDGTVRMDFINAELGEQLANLEEPESIEEEVELPSPRISSSIKDTTPVTDFLKGKNCLKGGSGWWKYEFCYGKHVRQVHADQSGEISVLLGVFDEQLHKQWLKSNPSKRPKPVSVRTELSHFYQGGTVCDKTGEGRQTEVKLKCLQNVSSPATVSMYLLEPKVCQYILVVESPLICDVLRLADDNGLVSLLPTTSEQEKSYAENKEETEIRYEND